MVSRLSRKFASAWLAELQRFTCPGAANMLTPWGRRYRERLQQEPVMQQAGQEIHWYSKICPDAAGDLDALIVEYNRADFVWFNDGNSESYREAFIRADALRTLLDKAAPRL